MRRHSVVALAAIVCLTPSFVLGATAPRGKPRSKPRPTAPATSASTAPDEKIKPTPAAAVVHEVAPGETLSSIAKQYQVTVSSLVIANRLRGPRAKLTLGQRLNIPRPGAATALRARRGPINEALPASLVLGVPEFDDPPSFQWPVAGAVTSTFGRRRQSWHRGLDIRADGGTPIVAAANGVVIASGFEPRYGQRVTIEHPGGFATVYAHNERNLVEIGQTVEAGQVIALVGRTGRATGEHLHFEVRYEGRVYNPLYVLPLPPRPVTVELTSSDQQDDDE